MNLIKQIRYTDIFSDNSTVQTLPHILVKSDNLQFLKEINQPVDVVYIDPPYNTGNKFKYNDSFDRESYNALLKNSITEAYLLLNNQSIFFCSIGIDELFRVKLICDEIFGYWNFVTCFSRKTGTTIKQDCKLVADNLDYILMYAKNKSQCTINKPEAKVEYPLKDEYFEKRGKYKLRNLQGPKKSQNNTFAIYFGTNHEKSVLPAKGQEWRWSYKHVCWGLTHGFIVFKNNKVYYKQYEKVDHDDNPITRTNQISNLLLNYPNYLGTKDLQTVLKKNTFSYPKPVELIKFLVNLHPNQKATVLDFFAGTGTTGQAVMELNALNHQNRRFILCTNNENNIFDEITQPRLELVATGKTEGLPPYQAFCQTNIDVFEIT